MRQNKIHGFIWVDQDWIGLLIFKNFADRTGSDSTFVDQDWNSDCKISQSAHL